MKKGFTLIELLVVVLIIGILSAIALPQYTRSVERARLVGATKTLEHWKTAQTLYYLSRGHFAQTWDELRSGDISFASEVDDDFTYQMPYNPGGHTVDIASIAARAKRRSGPYEDAHIYINVNALGEVERFCAGPQDGDVPTAKTREFCAMARNAGYTQAPQMVDY